MGPFFPKRPDPRTGPFESATAGSASSLIERAVRARRIGAVLSVIGAVLAVTLVVAGPLAKSVARSRGRALGLSIEPLSSSLRLGYFRFRGVSVSSSDLPGIAATFDRVDVYPGFLFGSSRLEVHGGHVQVRGSYDEIEREVTALKSRGHPSNASGSDRVTPIVADGVDVAWSGAAPRTGTEYAWGMRYVRAADGGESLGVDLVRAHMANIDVEVSRGDAAFRHDHGRRILTSVSAEGISGTLRLDGETEEPKAKVDDSKTHKAEEPSARGQRLRAELDHVVASLAGMLVAPGKIELAGARFTVLDGEDKLDIGPASIALERETDRVKLAFVPSAREASTPLRLEASVPTARGPVDVDVVGGPVSLEALGVKEGDMGLRGVDRAEVEIKGHARWSDDGRSIGVSGTSTVSDLGLFHPKLAPEPVRGIAVSVAGDGSFALDGSHADLSTVEVTVGKIRLETHGTLDRGDGFARGSLHVDIPLAACSDVLGSTPSALVPLLQGLEVTGTLAFSGDLQFDTRRPGDTRINWDAANECRVTRVPESLSPDRFHHAWVRTVLGQDGVPVPLETGPGTETWVPLTEISPFMQTAIVVCEDSRFFQHDGFDAKAIQDSIRNNLKAGSFVRGASTVSMQLAKNLYLGREKTLSRKLQEAVLTLLLEQVLTKEQILELYLNVIEFAPGLYGIGPAASYYFRSLPKNISLAQALYLASILPNPKNRHFMPDGTLSDSWSEYLRKLMVISHKIRRIDDHDLAIGLAETVRFGMAADPGSVPSDGDTAEVAPPSDGYPNADGP